MSIVEPENLEGTADDTAQLLGEGFRHTGVLIDQLVSQNKKKELPRSHLHRILGVLSITLSFASHTWKNIKKR